MVQKCTHALTPAFGRTLAAAKEVQHELQALIGSARAAALGRRLLDDVHAVPHHVAHDEQKPASKATGSASVSPWMQRNSLRHAERSSHRLHGKAAAGPGGGVCAQTPGDPMGSMQQLHCTTDLPQYLASLVCAATPALRYSRSLARWHSVTRQATAAASALLAASAHSVRHASATTCTKLGLGPSYRCRFRVWRPRCWCQRAQRAARLSHHLQRVRTRERATACNAKEAACHTSICAAARTARATTCTSHCSQSAGHAKHDSP